MVKDGSTDKEKIFVAEYLTNFNGTQAAIKAGYSKNTACEIASENLRKPHIQKMVRDFIDINIADKNKITKENIAFWVEMRGDVQANEQSRLKASEHLAKYGEMFSDKSELLIKTIDDEGKEVGILDRLRKAYTDTKS